MNFALAIEQSRKAASARADRYLKPWDPKPPSLAQLRADVSIAETELSKAKERLREAEEAEKAAVRGTFVQEKPQPFKRRA